MRPALGRSRPFDAGALSSGSPSLLFALVLALLLLLFTGTGCGDGESEDGTVAVTRRDLAVVVEITGELEAHSNASLGPPTIDKLWDFKISGLAPEGEPVSAGDFVIAFDTSELEQRLARAQADRDSAEATLEKTETDLDVAMRGQRLRLAEARARERKARLKVEVPEDTVARNELEQHRIDLELALAEIAYAEEALAQLKRRSDAELEALRVLAERARHEVRTLEDSIARMTVTAPRPGTLIYRTNWRGEKKKVGDRCWRNETVVQIPDLTTLMATAEVDEAEVARLAIGQRVEFTLDAHPGQSYTARVSKIGRSVQQRSWRDPRRVVSIELDLDRLDRERMRPGMRLVGELEVGRVENALAIPAQAVRFDEQGPWVLRQARHEAPERAEKVRPRLGLNDGEYIEVLEDTGKDSLEEGDRLALESIVASS